ncbi:MAG: type II secretion system protein [Verrucomicrobia bacterium]|nr:type II secretion system protein [Verrucomicrobiota bacterium]
MKSARSLRSLDPAATGRARRAFTLVEVLASLLMMAIIVPVAMEGMGIASRAGILGQRKVAALRIAERVIQESIIEAQTQQSTSSGVLAEGDTSYPWTLRIENWPEDAMQQITVSVTFTVQGNPYEVSLTTLLPVTTSDLQALADSPSTSQ